MEKALSQAQIQKILKNEHKSNKEINKLLDKEKEKLKNEVVLLLLGQGESGKSTVAKQLRILNSRPWTETERMTYKEIIISNVLKSVRDVVEALMKFGYSLQPENKDAEDKILSDILSPEVGEYIASLLKDEAVRNTLSRSGEFLL